MPLSINRDTKFSRIFAHSDEAWSDDSPTTMASPEASLLPPEAWSDDSPTTMASPEACLLPPEAWSDDSPTTWMWSVACPIPPEAFSDSESIISIDLHGSLVGNVSVNLIYEVMDITVASARETPLETRKSRGVLYLISYPLWGLPRDVLDTPLTLLNRAGLGVFIRSLLVGNVEDKYDLKHLETMPTIIVVSGVLIGFGVGLCTGFVSGPWGWYTVYLSSGVGALIGGAIGVAVALVLDVAYGYAVNPLQTLLLRAPMDSQYFKMRINLPTTGKWDKKNLRAYERTRWSYDYFPNWRYGANETTFSDPGEIENSVRAYRPISIEAK